MTSLNIIKKASKAVLAICGEQAYDEKKEYRLSDYAIKLDVPSGTLYHSCFTGELVEVTDESLAKEYLVNHWIYVENSFDEKIRIPGIKHLMKGLGLNQKQGYSTIEIITTTACNARCYYCYEEGFSQMSMDEKTAKMAVQFITKHCANKKVKIRWYGGEPMMNQSAISCICEGLSKEGILYSSTMISNGLLLRDEVIPTAKELWNLQNVRITLDGTEEQYNRIKNFKNVNGNAFEHVMHNVDSLLNYGISVTIRLNIEDNNIDDVKSLLKLLSVKYRNEPKIDFMLRPLNNTERNNTIESTGDERKQLLQDIIELKKRLIEQGYQINCGKLTGITFNTCIADSGKYIVIKPNGELAYCSADFDLKSYGTINCDQEKIPYPPISEFLIEKEKICDDCPLYPICSPSRLCPSCKRPICNSVQKEYNINDIKFIMIGMYQKYQQSKNNDK